MPSFDLREMLDRVAERDEKIKFLEDHINILNLPPKPIRDPKSYLSEQIPYKWYGRKGDQGSGTSGGSLGTGSGSLGTGGGGTKFCAGFGFGSLKCGLDISSLPITNNAYRIAG